MTWTVEDNAYMLQALAGYNPKDSTTSTAPVPDYSLSLREDIKGITIGVPRHFFFSPNENVNPARYWAQFAPVKAVRRLWNEGEQEEARHLIPTELFDKIALVGSADQFGASWMSPCGNHPTDHLPAGFWT